MSEERDRLPGGDASGGAQGDVPAAAGEAEADVLGASAAGAEGDAAGEAAAVEEAPPREVPLPGFDASGDVGHVRISDEVVGVIAGIAATEVEGVVGMAGGLVGGITEMLGRRNLAKGVRVEVGEREAAIDLYIIVEYGVRIPRVAQRVQENVKRAVESMTGLEVVSVNIHIQGVAFPSEEKGHETRVR